MHNESVIRTPVSMPWWMHCGSLHACYVRQLCMRLAGFANDRDASGHQSAAAVMQ